MAVFKKSTLRGEWQTYQLFRYGPVSLFYKPPVLQEAIHLLQEQNYIIHQFDCRDYDSEAALFNAILLRLNIIEKDYEGIKTVAFWDLLIEAKVPDESGLILVFTHFDVLHRNFPDCAQELLEIIAGYHYKWLWFGQRFKAFVQTDDPRIEFTPLGAHLPYWNDKEWLIKGRTP